MNFKMKKRHCPAQIRINWILFSLFLSKTCSKKEVFVYVCVCECVCVCACCLFCRFVCLFFMWGCDVCDDCNNRLLHFSSQSLSSGEKFKAKGQLVRFHSSVEKDRETERKTEKQKDRDSETERQR